MTRWQEERGVYWGRMKRKWYIKYYKSDRRTEKKEGWAAERGTEEEEEEEGWWTNSEPPVQSAAEVGKVFCGRCNYSENVKDGGRGSESGERERESCMSVHYCLSIHWILCARTRCPCVCELLTVYCMCLQSCDFLDFFMVVCESLQKHWWCWHELLCVCVCVSITDVR